MPLMLRDGKGQSGSPGSPPHCPGGVEGVKPLRKTHFTGLLDTPSTADSDLQVHESQR